MEIGFHYKCVCRGADGAIKWEDEGWNIVPTVGLNKFLDATLKTGLAAPAWYVGGVGATNTYNAADTLASHAGWAEYTHYTGSRKAFTPGTIAAGSVDNSGSPAVFTISGATGSETVNGFFICSAATGTSGTLLSEVNFTGGAKSVVNDDTLTVTATCAATST